MDTRERVATLLAEGRSVAEVAAALGISSATVCYHKRRLGHRMDARFARRYDWHAVQDYYDAGHSKRDSMQRFGFSAWAWAYAVERGDIVPRPHTAPLEEVLTRDRVRNRHHLKNRLIAAGLKRNECEDCGLTDWRGKPLSMALHHRNGTGTDNRLDNLVLLCPNCHAQTPNFGVRNRKPGAA
jgi:hypothetical protein